MPRARAIFEQASPLEVIPYPVVSYFTQISKLSDLQNGAYRFSLEYLKHILYRLHILPRI